MKNFKQALKKGKFSIQQNGVATLTLVLVIAILFLSISISISKSNLINFKSLEDVKNSSHSYYLSESGIEDSLIQLEENIDYSGNPGGETTPIGTYFSTIQKLGNNYTISANSTNGYTYRTVALNISLAYSLAPVVTKAVYMADFFQLSGEGAKIIGDVWTNDDFDIIAYGELEGNLTAAGKGSMAVNWVWDGTPFGDPLIPGGKILDNPDTPDAEGNVLVADTIKISGPQAYIQGNVVSDHYVWRLFGGTVGGTITQNANTQWQQIPVPNFDFNEYKDQAIQKGTFFSNANSFSNYLSSIDNGTERRLTEDIYYVGNGALKVEAGSPVYLNGLLVIEGDIYIYSEWHQEAQNGLPAIVAGNYIHIENKFNFKTLKYDHAGVVRISGILFAQKDINLFRTFADEDIIIEGAAWAGDDTFIGTHTIIDYNIDPLNVNGFDFVNGISDLTKNYWRESL